MVNKANHAESFSSSRYTRAVVHVIAHSAPCIVSSSRPSVLVRLTKRRVGVLLNMPFFCLTLGAFVGGSIVQMQPTLSMCLDLVLKVPVFIVANGNQIKAIDHAYYATARPNMHIVRSCYGRHDYWTLEETRFLELARLLSARK